MICCSGRRRWAGRAGSLPDERGRVFLGAARCLGARTMRRCAAAHN